MFRAQKSQFLVAVLAAFFLLSQACHGSEYDDGIKALKERRFAEATKLLQRAWWTTQSDPEALYYLAVSEHYQGLTGNALTHYQILLKRYPTNQHCKAALQAISGISLKPGSVDAQNYPKAGQAAASPRVNTVQTYAPGSAGRSRSAAPSQYSLPEKATLFFEYNDKQLRVDCFINNRPVKMVFDTGATGVVIGKNQLEELGIKTPEGNPMGTSGGSALDGEQPFWMIKADLKVATIFRPGFPIKVISYNSGPPLLGQTFIQDFDYAIDLPAGAIRLTRKGASNPMHATLPQTQSSSVPFLWEGTKMVVNVEVNGRPYPMYFDTGNSAAAVTFAVSDLKKLNLNTDESEGAITGGVTGSGSALRFKVKRLKLGPIEKFDVTVLANYSALERPLIGQQMYEGYEYTVDNNAKLIKFIRR
ncbi:MAG: retroviral-like aspartic protease family protein [Candidatus Melainabacteria bacterium]|jgi:predicted aspartyl protease|nr:retroviral-like aspartic protease family protein [Candidatus Melainabacteria bacterium]